MSFVNEAIAELERRNRQFWAIEGRRRDGRMRNPVVLAEALRRVQDEELRLPVQTRISLEQLLAEADAYRGRIEASPSPNGLRILASQLGQKGGAAKKGDALHKLIIALLSAKPGLKQADLLQALKASQAVREVIQDITPTEIIFEEEDGTCSRAPISGLKDRIFKARKQLKSL